MTEHTPIPWQVWASGGDWEVWAVNHGADHAPIAIMDRSGDVQRHADATFIVRAVNNFDGLVAALEAIAASDSGEWIERGGATMHLHPLSNKIVADMRAALAKAKEEAPA